MPHVEPQPGEIDHVRFFVVRHHLSRHQHLSGPEDWISSLSRNLDEQLSTACIVGRFELLFLQKSLTFPRFRLTRLEVSDN